VLEGRQENLVMAVDAVLEARLVDSDGAMDFFQFWTRPDGASVFCVFAFLVGVGLRRKS